MRIIATMRVPIVTMQGIHPRAIAMSNSCGHWQYTSVAQARKRAGERRNTSLAADGADLPRRGLGTQYVVGRHVGGRPERSGNRTPATAGIKTDLMPIAPDPVSGQQAFHDTVVKVSKVG